jgi:hypothetical protein
MAAWSTLYTRSPTFSDAIGRSPVGVATGVSAAAQTGHGAYCHTHTPLWSHAMSRPQEQGKLSRPKPQCVPGMLHGVPALGATVGHSDLGGVQYHFCQGTGAQPKGPTEWSWQ